MQAPEEVNANPGDPARFAGKPLLQAAFVPRPGAEGQDDGHGQILLLPGFLCQRLS